MSFVEVWTENAVVTYEKVIANFLEFSSNRRAAEFIDRVDQVVQMLRKYPGLYESSIQRGDVRRCVVVPEISLFYLVDQNYVVLLTFWDNRGEPEKLQI
jgi:plasmid stabilization system protein ParE